MAQVRLDDEVAAALARVAARDGGSVAQAANRKLRQALGLHPRGATPAAPKSGARPGVATASGARPRATSRGLCMHPVGRRIDGMCMVCGAQVGGRARSAG